MSQIELTVGVELETQSNLDRDAFKAFLPKYWKVVSDSSIPGGGWEAVSNVMTEEDIEKGVVSKTVEALKKGNGKFVDAKSHPKSAKDLLEWEAVKLWSARCRQYKKEKNLKRLKWAQEELVLAYKKLGPAWEEQQNRARLSESRDSSCGFHVHIGVKGMGRRPTPRQMGFIQAVYAFYYPQFSHILPECRRKEEKGTAHGWCEVIIPGPDSSLEIGGGDKYRAVNTNSNHPTVEFRQGSINSLVTPEAWIQMLLDITRGALLAEKKYPREALNTTKELYAKLPKRLKRFRELTWWENAPVDVVKPREGTLLAEKFPPHLLASVPAEKWPQSLVDSFSGGVDEAKIKEEAMITLSYTSSDLNPPPGTCDCSGCMSVYVERQERLTREVERRTAEARARAAEEASRLAVQQSPLTGARSGRITNAQLAVEAAGITVAGALNAEQVNALRDMISSRHTRGGYTWAS